MALTVEERIRVQLYRNALSQTWLIREIERRHGITVDKSILSDAIRGVRGGKKPQQILAWCCEILDDYEKRFTGESIDAD